MYIYVYKCICIYIFMIYGIDKKYNDNDVLMMTMMIYKNNSRHGDEESVCVYMLRVIVTCK